MVWGSRRDHVRKARNLDRVLLRKRVDHVLDSGGCVGRGGQVVADRQEVVGDVSAALALLLEHRLGHVAIVAEQVYDGHMATGGIAEERLQDAVVQLRAGDVLAPRGRVTGHGENGSKC